MHKKSFLTRIFVLTSIIIAACIAATYLLTVSKERSKEAEEKEEKAYPSDWEWMQRTFPYYTADNNVYTEAIEKAVRIKEATEKQYLGKNKLLPSWEFAGPENIGGRIVDIEFNPKNPNIVYAAAATGGVLKSTDKGKTWFHIFDNQTILTIGDIAIDPKEPETIYVGTGEANGGHNNMPGGGIFKTKNGGRDWEFLGLEKTASIGRIIIDPVNTNNVYAAAVGAYFSPNEERGIFKSTNGGASWNKSLFISDSTGAIDLIMDPSNPSFLMASMWERVRRPQSSHLYGPSSGIYRSTDGGTKWTELTSVTGLPDAKLTAVGRIGLAVSPSNPAIAYALYNNGTEVIGLYKTTNFGNNWTKLDPQGMINSGVSNFSWYFGQVRVHPAKPNQIYVLDVSFMRSTDGGASWPINYGYGGPEQLHVDHHALAFSPDNPDYIIEGNDGGINISADGGLSWSNRAQIAVTQFYEIGLDYKNPQRLYGGTQDNNTVRTLSGKTNDWQSIIGGDGFYVSVDYNDPNYIYAESQNGYLLRTTDGGMTFYNALSGIVTTEPRNWSTPVIIDPNKSNVLYYGTNRLYRSTNRAVNWSPVSDKLTFSPDGSRLGTITTIAAAPGNSNVIYAGTDDANIWVTKDYGQSWKLINKGLPFRWVTRIAVDPKNENIVYATFSGLKWKDPQPHVFRSTDYGESWSDISSNLPDAPVNAFAIDLNNQDILYAGSDVGAFVSFNKGLSWQTLGSGLPVVSVYDLKIHPVTNYLIAGTHGRSMYRLNLNQLTGIDQKHNRPIAESYKLLQNYPNPFNPATTISYSLPRNSLVKLTVFDIQGKEVKSLVNEVKSAGSYQVEFNATNLPSGVYLYRLEAAGYSETKKLLLLK